MRKAYFATPFVYDNDDSLQYDSRSVILGSQDLLKVKKHGNEHPVISLDGESLIYTGPFYYEETANGVFTDSDCYGVVRKELSLIDNCDVVIALLDGTLAPGTVAELIYAAMKQKEIVLFYLEEEADYDINSLYWYPIVAAQLLCTSIRVIPYKSYHEVFAHFGIDADDTDYDDLLKRSCVIKQIYQ